MILSESDRSKLKALVESKPILAARKPIAAPPISKPSFEPPSDYTVILDMLKRLEQGQENLQAKRRFDFEIQRNKSGLITNIIATEL